MSIIEVYEHAFGQIDLSTKNEIIENLKLIQLASQLDAGQRDTLIASFNSGPLDDGCVPSKAGRDELLKSGLIAKTIKCGEWGYNACTYKGAWVAKVLGVLPDAMRTIPDGAARTSTGTTYFNIAEMGYKAEDRDALNMWLDDQKVPSVDSDGKAYSSVGRVMRLLEQSQETLAAEENIDFKEEARDMPYPEEERGTIGYTFYIDPSPKAAGQQPAATYAGVYHSRYTIEWTDGPLPVGTKLYVAREIGDRD